MNVPLSAAGQSNSAPAAGSGWPVALSALVGCALSVYLALFQYGWFTTVWDPLFGSGSEKVLSFGLLDPLGRWLGFPVHDAALGAMAYAIEAGAAIAAARARPPWRRWVAGGYCGLVLMMGLTGLGLVILQATVVRAWCLLCLTSAAISEVIVLLSWREVAAGVGALFGKTLSSAEARP